MRSALLLLALALLVPASPASAAPWPSQVLYKAQRGAAIHGADAQRALLPALAKLRAASHTFGGKMPPGVDTDERGGLATLRVEGRDGGRTVLSVSTETEPRPRAPHPNGNAPGGPGRNLDQVRPTPARVSIAETLPDGRGRSILVTEYGVSRHKSAVVSRAMPVLPQPNDLAMPTARPRPPAAVLAQRATWLARLGRHRLLPADVRASIRTVAGALAEARVAGPGRKIMASPTHAEVLVATPAGTFSVTYDEGRLSVWTSTKHADGSSRGEGFLVAPLGDGRHLVERSRSTSPAPRLP